MSVPSTQFQIDSGDSRRRGLIPFAFALLVVVGLSWWWLVAMARDMYGAMTGPSAWMMTDVWDVRHLVLLWTMWAVMMAAMMLPSAWPMLAMYGAMARRQRATVAVRQDYLFAAGYLAVWALFSIAATVLQRLLAEWLLLSPMMTLASPRASAALLAGAGVYQWTPLKRICLVACRSPLSFLTRSWRPGAGGAFRMGVDYGAYCVGCCWVLMLLLFVGGVMNLYVIAALASVVALEKLLPGGEQGARVGGVLLVALAAWIAFHGG